jgi:hypothetical protein
MKNLINIYNPTTGNKSVTLDELREMIALRRKVALNPVNRSSVKITVMCTDKSSQQVAAHYKSFEIYNFGPSKAIEVFNQGGCQVANYISK